jgi:pseudouridine-5'-phosphate glycosidase
LLRISPEIAAALNADGAVVGLESSVLAQGLPEPTNRDAERRMTAAVRAADAVPAIIGVARGVPVVGLGGDDLERFLRRDGVRKVTARDLALAIASGSDGATTVAGSLALAHVAGIVVFATGGLGGVHARLDLTSAVRDESADLVELSRTPMVVVCSGMKSILDLDATMERLETLGVAIVGYRTAELPGFLTAGTGISLSWCVDDVAQIAAAWRAQRALGRAQSLVVVQRPPAAQALSRGTVEDAVHRSLEAAQQVGVRGSAVTPWLLAEVERATGGASLVANLALLERNAALAGEIAVELARRPAAEQDNGRVAR